MNSFHNKELIKNILNSNSYQYKDWGDYLTCQALFRNGQDIGSVVIYPGDELAIDYVTAEHYDLDEFIKLIINKKTDEELEEYYKKNNIILNKQTNSGIKIKQQKIFDNSILNELVPIYDYWVNRGINENILKELKSGVFCGKGVFKGQKMPMRRVQ